MTKEKETTKKHTNTSKNNKNIRNNKRVICNNPYKLVKNKTDIGIGMLVGTFLRDNRQEQLVILVEVYEIPVDNNLINIEH